MNPKIEIIKGKVGIDKHFEKFRHELKQFAETHRIVNISTTLDVQDGTLFATILYEEIDNK